MEREGRARIIKNMNELYDLEKELTEAKNKLGEIADKILQSAKDEVNYRSDYEEKKNKFLLLCYAEENDRNFKRTEQHRKSMYRDKFADERRAWLFAKADYESNRELYKGLLSKIEALRTLVSLEKSKMNLQ